MLFEKKTLLRFIIVYIFSLLTDAEWHQVWQDEFNGNALNETNWQYVEGCNGFGNNEKQCYTAHRIENVRVENGSLTIHVNVEEFKGKHFTSAKLTSKQSWTYGKFETKAKLPKGKHLWPAIWMMPQKSVYGGWAASGEIDILEARGNRPKQILGTIHFGGECPDNHRSGSESVVFNNDFTSDFHTYSLEWDKSVMKWLLDGKVWHTENMNRSFHSGYSNNPYSKKGQPFDQAFYLILNVAVGGNFFPTSIYGEQVTRAEAKLWAKPKMEVDYVRVWEWK